MRLKHRLLLVFVSALPLFVTAQPEAILEKWSGRSPIEKMYIHFDRDNYLAGDNIWFKVYLYSEYFPDTISTCAYIELLNPSSVVIERKIVPVFWGNAIGDIELPDSLETGSYMIRAYTPTMLNQDAAFVFRRSLFVYGKNNSIPPQPLTPKKQLEFFPEGGNFISDMSNTIAVKATDENGLPANVDGIIKDGTNQTVADFSSYHDGMSFFDITPSKSSRYYALINGDSSSIRYYLPEQSTKGIVFKLIPHPAGSYFELTQRPGDASFEAAYMIGQMQHHIVFRFDFSTYKDQLQGVINTQRLASGILQVTIFNKDGMPLAERLVFVDNKEYIQPAELIADTVNFTVKSKNRLTVFLKDTIQANLSISVTDPEYGLTEREENIFSSILLTSDIKGYVHHPSYYFSADNDSVKTARDLLMMTQGWRRFKWTELAKGIIPASNFSDPAYITLSGRTNIRDTRKPFADKEMAIFIFGADSSRSMQLVKTDQQGNFRLDSLLFFGPVKLLFSDIRGKKNKFIEVGLSADSLARLFMLPPLEKRPFYMRPASSLSARLAFDYDAIMKASGLMLQAVVVKARKKSPLQELEEKYASGLFSGFSERTFDLVNSKDVIYETNIFDYLRGRVPGLSIQNDGLDYTILYRQGATVSSMGAFPMTLYLDEVETDASFISAIPANQIAMVKLYTSFAGAVGNAPGGVLAIYTKKGTDLSSLLTGNTDQVRYKGYSISKEFYSPDYSKETTPRNKTDHRITLQWLPDIYVNTIDATVPVVFYNNDRSQHFKVVVEGMTRNGKLIHLEKTINSKPF